MSNYVYTDEDLLRIHHVLHDPEKEDITINNKVHLVMKGSNGCRKISLGGYNQIMVQNKNKNSSYATRAKNGEQLSWFMGAPRWRLITDKGAEGPSAPFTTDNTGSVSRGVGHEIK